MAGGRSRDPKQAVVAIDDQSPSYNKEPSDRPDEKEEEEEGKKKMMMMKEVEEEEEEKLQHSHPLRPLRRRRNSKKKHTHTHPHTDPPPPAKKKRIGMNRLEMSDAVKAKGMRRWGVGREEAADEATRRRASSMSRRIDDAG